MSNNTGVLYEWSFQLIQSNIHKYSDYVRPEPLFVLQILGADK